MIEFKVIATHDKSQQSTYQHSGTELRIGSAEGDLILDDPKLGAMQIRIYREGAGFWLENLDESIEVRLNGKPIAGPSPIKDRDSLTMGRTTISFSRIDSAPLTPPPPYENPHAGQRFAEGNKEKAILDALSQLEAQAGGAPPPPRSAQAPKPSMPPLPPRKP